MARALDAALRWLRHSPSGHWVGARLLASYVRIVVRTTSWRIEGRENYDRLLSGDTGVIVVMWHGRLFMSPIWGSASRKTVAMISNNRDGELISAIVGRFDVVAVRGSSYDHEKRREKGGARAYVAARRELVRHHAVLGISPDGPRGPRMRAQPGAAQLAIETGAPIQPVTFSARRGRVLGSWDRFLVPWPFGRGVQIWGSPLYPPAAGDEAGADRFRGEIEASLIAITACADTLCGRTPVEPEPPIARS